MNQPDFRQEAAKNRRLTLGCLSVFVGVPLILGIVITFANNGPRWVPWALCVLAVGALAYLVVLIVRTFNLENVKRTGEKGKYYGS